MVIDYAFAIVRSFILPTGLGGKASGFTPTGSLDNSLNERRAGFRAPLHHRLKVILIDCGAIFHLAVVVLTMLGVVSSIRHAFKASNVGLALLVTVAWPPPHWLNAVIACLAPIQYAVFPPDVPDRHEVLDKRSGVAYPKTEAKDATWTLKEARYPQLYSLVVAYTAIIFVGTWWL